MDAQPPVQPPSEHVCGLPQHLPAGSVATLLHDGAAIAIAVGDKLTTYMFEVPGGRATVRQDGEHALPGPALAVVESMLGLVICTEHGDASELLLLRDRELVRLMSLPARTTALTAAGSDLYAVLVYRDRYDARLVRISLRQRTAVADRPLDHRNVSLP